MTVECISEENGELKKFLPIDINKEKYTKWSQNLSKFQYKFSEINSVAIRRNDGIKGFLESGFNIPSGYVKMTTMGNLFTSWWYL